MSSLAARRPLALAVGTVLIPLVGVRLLDAGTASLGVSDLAGRLVIESLFAGYAFLLTRLGWWRAAGFRRPEDPRRLAATLPLFLLPLIVLAGTGIKAAPGERVLGFRSSPSWWGSPRRDSCGAWSSGRSCPPGRGVPSSSRR